MNSLCFSSCFEGSVNAIPYHFISAQTGEERKFDEVNQSTGITRVNFQQLLFVCKFLLFYLLSLLYLFFLFCLLP